MKIEIPKVLQAPTRYADSLNIGDQLLRKSDGMWYPIKSVTISTNINNSYKNHPLLFFHGFCILKRHLGNHFETTSDGKLFCKESG